MRYDKSCPKCDSTKVQLSYEEKNDTLECMCHSCSYEWNTACADKASYNMNQDFNRVFKHKDVGAL